MNSTQPFLSRLAVDPSTRKPRLPAAPLRAALGAALLLVALPALAVKPFTADYDASYMGLQGQGKMTLVEQGKNTWKYSMDISSNLVQSSQSTVFEDRNGQWRPLSSDDRSMLLIKKVNQQAHYDWKANVATWTGDVKQNRAGPVELKSGDMDALMINLALPRDVAAGKPLTYRMVDDGRAKPLTYEVAGKEAITVSGKEQMATKVVRTDGNKQTIAWVVEGMPVPARLLQRKDGQDEIDLRIRALR